jgi:hypothetical protein
MIRNPHPPRRARPQRRGTTIAQHLGARAHRFLACCFEIGKVGPFIINDGMIVVCNVEEIARHGGTPHANVDGGSILPSRIRSSVGLATGDDSPGA